MCSRLLPFAQQQPHTDILCIVHTHTAIAKEHVEILDDCMMFTFSYRLDGVATNRTGFCVLSKNKMFDQLMALIRCRALCTLSVPQFVFVYLQVRYHRIPLKKATRTHRGTHPRKQIR